MSILGLKFIHLKLKLDVNKARGASAQHIATFDSMVEATRSVVFETNGQILWPGQREWTWLPHRRHNEMHSIFMLPMMFGMSAEEALDEAIEKDGRMLVGKMKTEEQQAVYKRAMERWDWSKDSVDPALWDIIKDYDEIMKARYLKAAEKFKKEIH